MCYKMRNRYINKNRTYYPFNDTININNFVPNNIKTDENSYKHILIHYIGYVTIKDSKYVKIYTVNLLYHVFKNVHRHFQEINRDKYFVLVAKWQQREIKKYEELWSKIRDLIKSVTKTSDDYDEKYMKIKFS